MIYATLTDLEARLPSTELSQLADRDNSGKVDGSTINAALRDASELIDSYLRSRYALPLPYEPRVLIGICCQIARHKLYVHARPDHVKTDYEAALKYLRDIQSEKASLDIGGTEAPAEDGAIIIDGPDRTFSRTTLRDY